MPKLVRLLVGACRSAANFEDERGSSAVEYGLLIAGIAALVVVSVFALGGTVGRTFESTCKAVASTATCQ